MKALYTTIAKTHGGRNGRVETTDGLLKLHLAMPIELGGKGGATNPEQLFAAGYAACFESAIRHVANVQKISLEDVSMASEVSLYATPEKGFKLGVALHAYITGLNQNEAEALVAQAHEVCPYSNAIRGNVAVKLSVSVK
ncbi:TPA: Ohr family peroxiredoxin [Legionella pneumophila]|nr:organic hydroperoxide resistance protein [Legionella pneumophila]HAT7769340.1 Ohr family peroxiredoxin [Legionella pneumophila]HAU1604128.1 organic hydroperoxide resistance protein [Legionella pneumophila]HAU1717332.1 organic hydroperoxide resistance protein [Legionella pneumophila]HAU1847149.1 organic hydroperoxide resistance protein [Legionella pneumophila]